jgi:hypothetical protein
VLSGCSIRTFRDNLGVLSSRIKKSKERKKNIKRLKRVSITKYLYPFYTEQFYIFDYAYIFKPF